MSFPVPVGKSVVQTAILRLGATSNARIRADAPRVRCASLLKPLLFWVAARHPSFRELPRWRRLAEPAIVMSANEPTTAVWNEVGQTALLDGLAEVTGIRWSVDPGGRSFGRVLVSADEVASAYRALVMASVVDRPAEQILRWMQEIPDSQAFGLRSTAADAAGTPPERVALKCGWFCDTDEHHIRTHAVTITGWGSEATPVADGTAITGRGCEATPVADGTAVTCTLTALPMTRAERIAYAVADAIGDELPIHEAHAGDLLRSTTRRLLSA